MFVAPGVVLTNDPRAGRRRPGEELAGAVLRRACRIGAGAVLLPGHRGRRGGASSAAGSVVTRDVPAAHGGDGRARAGRARRARGGAALRLRSRQALAPTAARWRSGAVAAAAVAAVAVGEIGRVWRRGSAPGADGVRQPAAGRRGGGGRDGAGGPRGLPRRSRPARTRSSTCWRASPRRFLATRWITYALRERQRFGPFRNLRVGRRHIHHFVPGIVLAFVAGAAAILTRERGARAEARRSVRGRDGPDPRRVGAPARARRRLLAPRGPAQRADHAGRDRAALGAHAGAAPAARAASRSCSSRAGGRSAEAAAFIRAVESGPPPEPAGCRRSRPDAEPPELAPSPEAPARLRRAGAARRLAAARRPRSSDAWAGRPLAAGGAAWAPPCSTG